MPNITPISDLRNYGQVLEKVNPNSPVYLTKNGRGEYSVHSIKDDEEYEQTKAMLKLMTELVKGIKSGEEEGWVSEDAFEQHFAETKAEMRSLYGTLDKGIE